MKHTLLRHANAAGGTNDMNRELTALGREQAVTRGLSLPEKFDLVISSPTMRTRQTAAIVAAIDDMADIIVCDGLYTPKGSDGEAMNKLFEELGYSPFRKYVNRAADLFCRYGEGAIKDIHDILNDHPDAGNILIVGHAVLLNSLGQQLNDSQSIIDYSFGECGGLHFSDNNVVTYIT